MNAFEQLKGAITDHMTKAIPTRGFPFQPSERQKGHRCPTDGSIVSSGGCVKLRLTAVILSCMSQLALTLVLFSAVAHATWNFMLKRSNNQEVFIWWSLVSISVLLLPLAVVLAWRDPIVHPGWLFLLVTSLLHFVYFLLLARSYTHADLSVVYPIARGAGPALVPILGVLVLKESVAPLAVAGIVAVVLGIYTVYWWGLLPQILKNPFKFLRETGTRYALLTGLVIAIYSVWDKEGVSYVNPFLYMYIMSVGSALLLAPYVLQRHGTKLLRAEWRTSAGLIVAVGLLVFLAYGLVLTAMQFSRVSYIAPSREIGIVIGVLLGVLVLREPFGKGRFLGSSLIVAGIVLIALAP